MHVPPWLHEFMVEQGGDPGHVQAIIFLATNEEPRKDGVKNDATIKTFSAYV